MSVDDRTLVQTLEELRREFPQLRFGQIVCTLAILARDDEPASIWEVEDDELLAAAQKMLANKEGVAMAERRE